MKLIPIAAALLAAACTSVAPVKIQSGDVCFRCRRVILDSRLAAETIDRVLPLKFRTSGCVAKYLAEHPQDASTVFVTDFPSGKLIASRFARFVPTVNRDTGEEDYIAFADRAAADAEAFSRGARAVTWDDVLTAAREWRRQQVTAN